MTKHAHRGASFLFLLSTASAAAPTDESVLFQTVVGAKHEGKPDKPVERATHSPVESGAAGGDMIKVGERMEVVVLEGAKAGSWIKCRVKGPGALPGTYDVLLMGLGNRLVPNVPSKALRRPPPQEKSDGVLFFWAVSGKPYTIDLVTRNIDHLRKTYPPRADVYFVHYDGGKNDWLERDEVWYKQNVQFSEEERLPRIFSGSSSMLFATSYFPPQIALAKKLVPELLAKRQYEWVWMVDEDLDFTTANITRLFRDAESTDALMVAPSVKFEDRLQKHPTTKLYLPGCSRTQEMCFIHTPKPQCHFRYVNFIEVMFPIMRPGALKELSACGEKCEITVDRLWCRLLSQQLQHPHDQACAILDQVSVVHTNGKTLRKWESADQLHAGFGQMEKVHGQTWVSPGDLGAYTCVN